MSLAMPCQQKGTFPFLCNNTTSSSSYLDFDNGLVFSLAEKVASLDASNGSPSTKNLARQLSREKRIFSAPTTASGLTGGGCGETCDESVFQNNNQAEIPIRGRSSVATGRPYDPECPYCNKQLSRRNSSSAVLDEEGVALMQILEFPAKVFAIRQPVDLVKSYPKSKRVILRDVKRTDRVVHYFK